MSPLNQLGEDCVSLYQNRPGEGGVSFYQIQMGKDGVSLYLAGWEWQTCRSILFG